MASRMIRFFFCFFSFILQGAVAPNDVTRTRGLQKLSFVQTADRETQKAIESDFTRSISSPITVCAHHVSIAPVKQIDKSGFYSMAVALSLVTHVKKQYFSPYELSFDRMQKNDWIVDFKTFWEFYKKKRVSDMNMVDVLTLWNRDKCGVIKKTTEDKDGRKNYRFERLPMSFLNARGEEVKNETVTAYEREMVFTDGCPETVCEYETRPLGETLLPFVMYLRHEHIFIVNVGGNCFPLVVIQNNKNERAYYFADPLRDENRLVTNKPVTFVVKNAFKAVDYITDIEKKIAYIQSR